MPIPRRIKPPNLLTKAVKMFYNKTSYNVDKVVKML